MESMGSYRKGGNPAIWPSAMRRGIQSDGQLCNSYEHELHERQSRRERLRTYPPTK